MNIFYYILAQYCLQKKISNKIKNAHGVTSTAGVPDQLTQRAITANLTDVIVPPPGACQSVPGGILGQKQKITGGDAVIYARYSSHNQRDFSIEQQIEACRKYAASLSLKVTLTYEEPGNQRPHRQPPSIPAHDA